MFLPILCLFLNGIAAQSSIQEAVVLDQKLDKIIASIEEKKILITEEQETEAESTRI